MRVGDKVIIKKDVVLSRFFVTDMFTMIGTVCTIKDAFEDTCRLENDGPYKGYWFEKKYLELIEEK